MTLGPDKTDYTVSLAKGIIGAIPAIGPLAAQVIGNLIPNQRLDRIESLLKSLSGKVQGVDPDALKDRFKKAEFIDLLEDSFHQAARALSSERIEYISNIIANGIKKEDADYIRYKKMLFLLESINDIEIMLLVMYGRSEMGDNSYMEKHKEILSPKRAVMGSNWEEVEDAYVQESYKSHLVDLGLLRTKFKKPRRGESPEFDEKTGKMKASGYQITVLGRLLLMHIGEETIYER